MKEKIGLTIEKELLAIKGSSDMLVAEDVVEWARAHPKSKLHSELEWDDSKAGHNYRIWQVRRLIGLHITYADGDRKFVSLSLDRHNGSGGGYRDVDDVLRDKTLYDLMLDDALRELERFRRRYDHLKQLKPLWTAVDKVVKRTSKRKGREGEARAGAA